MVLGSAFHKIVLEPDDFESEFTVSPNINRRTNEGKALYAEWQEKAKGKRIVDDDDLITITRMRDSIMANKYAVQLLSNGESEKSFYWTDELTKIDCKCRPDYHRKIKDRVLITDLKSCQSADNDSIMREVVKRGYDLQAGMYREGLSIEFGIAKENVDFIFIFVEKKPPYLINIVQANELVMQRGENLMREYLGTYKECLDSGIWYGFNGVSEEFNELSLPAYLTSNI